MSKYILLFLVCWTLVSCNRVMERNTAGSENILTKRIHEYYLSWEKLDLEKMWSLISPDKVGSKEEFVKEWEKSDLKVKRYEIQNITIIDGSAKVKVKLTLFEHGEETTGTCFDYWKKKDDDWVLVDSGRSN